MLDFEESLEAWRVLRGNVHLQALEVGVKIIEKLGRKEKMRAVVVEGA